MNKIFIAFLILFTFATPIAHSQIFQNAPVINFNYRQDWSAANTYAAGDAVRSPTNGYLYVATGPVAAGGTDPGVSQTNPPAPPPSPWAFGSNRPVERGLTGETGADGEDGSSIVGYFQESANEPTVTGEAYARMVYLHRRQDGLLHPRHNPTNAVWLVLFRLDGDGNTYTRLSLTRITGIRGPPGRDGNDGNDGQRGLTGNPGADGAPGADGEGTRLIYRKSLSYELTTAPTVTFDGTNFTLPATDNNAWQLSWYISRIQSHWVLAGSGNNAPDHASINPQDIDIDTSVQPNRVYVLDANDHGNAVGGYVYIYDTDGAYINRWSLVQANNTAIDLDVRGSYVRVLDGRTVGSQRVYVYNKDDGGRQSNQEFIVPDASAPVVENISTQGSSIYLTSVDRIRRFSITTNVEQTTGTLGSLSLNPVGTDANDFYFFIVDRTDNKVYVRDINTLSLRHTIREWDLTSSNAEGIAVGEFEVLILDTDSTPRL